jgi:hypothetical protein
MLSDTPSSRTDILVGLAPVGAGYVLVLVLQVPLSIETPVAEEASLVALLRDRR